MTTILNNLTPGKTEYGGFAGYGLTSPAISYSYPPDVIQETLGLQRAAFKSAAQRVRADFGVTDARNIQGNISQLHWYVIKRGQRQPFNVKWPQIVGTKAVTGVTVVGTVAANSDTIRLSGLPADGFNGTRLVQFAGHSKLYFLEHVKSVAGGFHTYEIVPNLLAEVAAASAVNSSPESPCVLVGATQINNTGALTYSARVTVQEHYTP